MKQTMKIVKKVIEALKEDLRFNKQQTSLLGHNMVWFSNCSWLDQLECQKQTYRYISYK
jgi:hypothetical protein